MLSNFRSVCLRLSSARLRVSLTPPFVSPFTIRNIFTPRIYSGTASARISARASRREFVAGSALSFGQRNVMQPHILTIR